MPMSKIDAFMCLGRVVSYWALFSLFLTGAVMMNVFIWMPQSLTGPLGKFGKEMGVLTIKSPPYVWMGFTVEQLLVFGTMVDIVGMLGLMNFPKLSATIVMMMTGWQQMFYRLNIDKLPNHPLCGYASPHCFTVDMVRFTILAAALFVFTAPLPLPETSVNFLKQLGVRSRWMDRGLKTIREYIPLQVSVNVPSRGSPTRMVPEEATGGKPKDT